MDRDPVQYISNFMRRAEVLVEAQTDTAPMTNLERHSFLLDQLLGHTGTTTDQTLGIPISWIRDSSTLRTLQATARAVLPTANPPPAAVTYSPTANATDFAGCIDWSAHQAETPPEKLEDNPVGRTILDMFRRKLLQEEIDSKAVADSLDAPTNEAKEEELEDLEIDLNNLDQQWSECQQLQAEADKKPAAKTAKSNDDGDKQMPAKKAKSSDKKPAAKKEPPKENDKDKKMPASARKQAPPLQPHQHHHQARPTKKTAVISSAEVTQWLRQHKAKVSIEDGSVQADCPIPPQIQQWLDNDRREAAALRQREARSSQ